MKIVNLILAVCVIIFAVFQLTAQSAAPPEYKIINSTYTDRVEHGVFDALINGYELYGDLVLGRDRNGDVVYVQVVTK